jgi:hypothetical protein
MHLNDDLGYSSRGKYTSTTDVKLVIFKKEKTSSVA